MSEQQAKTFSLDGTEYDVDTISDTAKYFVFNLNELGQKRVKVEAEMLILNAAEKSLIEDLRKALEDKEEEKETGA